MTRIRLIDSVLIYLLVAFSVIPFFSENKNLLLLITILLILALVLKKKLVFSIHFMSIIILLLVMYIGQVLVLNLTYVDLKSVFGTFIRFLFPFLVIKIVGNKFIDTFIQVVFLLALISFAFWISENLSSDVTNSIRAVSENLKLDEESNENILVYNQESKKVYGIIRNAGFAYEGGAYSIILLIALVLNLLKNQYAIDSKSKIFIAAILSTFSTAGYAALAFLFYGYMYNKFKSKANLIIFSMFYFALISYAYINLSFLEDKIQSQIKIASDLQSAKGRFGSALADLQEWKRSPIFGVGKFKETRFMIFKSRYEQHRTNGLADFLAKFGLIVFVGYFYIMFLSLKKLNLAYLRHNKNHIFQFLALLITAFSQTCLQWSVFIMLLYFGDYSKSNKIENEKSSYFISQ